MPTPAEIRRESALIITKDVLRPFLPNEQEYRQLVSSLLEHRENTGPGPNRNQALRMLWELASIAARFGVALLDIQNGFSEFHISPIPSSRLVELGIITDVQTIKQVKIREKGRKERKKRLPENRVTVKAATDQELEERNLSGLKSVKPILLIEEHYTIAVHGFCNVEIDTVGYYALFQDAPDHHQLLFLGETQDPHAHARVAGQWLRIDKTTHPDFRLPPGIHPPKARTVEKPSPAANDQIAALLALFTEGIKG